MQVATGRMGDLRRTGGLEGVLREMMLDGAGTPRRLKTFTAEMEGAAPPRSRYGRIDWGVRPTTVDGVSIVTCRDNGGDLPECELALDRRRGRFCLIHIAEEDAVAERVVSALARTTQLNRAWVCPSTIAGIAGDRPAAVEGGRGVGSAVRVEGRDPGGCASADVRCDGMVAHAGGDSVGVHLRTAGEILTASAEMCANAERFRIGASDTPRGARFDLDTIDITMSRKIEDVPGFVSGALDGKPPLLMEGRALRVGGDHYQVPVLDVECRLYMGTDMSPGLVSIGLHHGCTGSGVLRLLAYLQMHQDPALTCDQVFTGARRA